MDSYKIFKIAKSIINDQPREQDRIAQYYALAAYCIRELENYKKSGRYAANDRMINLLEQLESCLSENELVSEDDICR